ncbi:hypothetical protein F5148DRAFT_664546 [Russula earlei]|uniref:Uncharacterized protein n=1 Tax=Russula earlei TaxID=71964 RepID=A0ACC0TV87_9AGAM|nr:hypothetical protein F5148DRAFT_664546 [Russula earlei]
MDQPVAMVSLRRLFPGCTFQGCIVSQYTQLVDCDSASGPGYDSRSAHNLSSSPSTPLGWVMASEGAIGTHKRTSNGRSKTFAPESAGDGELGSVPKRRDRALCASERSERGHVGQVDRIRRWKESNHVKDSVPVYQPCQPVGHSKLSHAR